MLILPTLGAWTLPSPEARIAHIVEMAKDPNTKPDLAPIDVGTNNVDLYDANTKRFKTDETVYLNTSKTLQYFAETINAAGVKPMQALWNVGSIRTTLAFVEMGLFQEPLYFEIALMEGGILSGHPGTVKGMEAFLDFLPSKLRCEWGVLCYGANLFPLVGAILERGGHISIGLGDYAYPELETPTNARLISRVAQMTREMGRQIATPEETRKALGLT
jgi:3-keto-5-aminohexanoate cleavage enzyme